MVPARSDIPYYWATLGTSRRVPSAFDIDKRQGACCQRIEMQGIDYLAVLMGPCHLGRQPASCLHALHDFLAILSTWDIGRFHGHRATVRQRQCDVTLTKFRPRSAGPRTSTSDRKPELPRIHILKEYRKLPGMNSNTDCCKKFVRLGKRSAAICASSRLRCSSQNSLMERSPLRLSRCHRFLDLAGCRRMC